MIKNFIEKSWLLIIAAFGFGVLLAGTNEWLAPKIKQQQIKKFNNLAGSMIEGAENFENVSEEPVIVKSASGKPLEVRSLKKGVNADGDVIGWAFVAEGSGFADRIQLVIGVDAEFEKIKGYGVLLSNETPGFGDKIGNPDHYFAKQFAGTPTERLELSKIGDWEKIEGDTEIIAISGATVTSEAVVSIFNTYVEQVKKYLADKGFLK